MKGNLAYFEYRTLARFAEVLPASAIGPVARLAGRIGPKLDRNKAELVASHLSRTTGERASNKAVGKTYASYVRYWLQALRLPVVPSEILAKSVRCDGLEHLEASREAGQGTILCVPHVGNWDVAGAWLVQSGIELVVVVEQLEPPKLFDWFTGFRESLGFEVVVNGPEVGSKLLSALRANKVVALLCDRDVDGSGIDIEFFGENALIPKGPAVLALRTGATLLPAAALEDGSGHRIVIDAPVVAERNGRLPEDVAVITQGLTRRIEGLIRRAPEQWHLFQPNWPSDRNRQVAPASPNTAS